MRDFAKIVAFLLFCVFVVSLIYADIRWNLRWQTRKETTVISLSLIAAIILYQWRPAAKQYYFRLIGKNETDEILSEIQNEAGDDAKGFSEWKQEHGERHEIIPEKQVNHE